MAGASRPTVLSRRMLNRATLDRQLLLRRSELSPLAAIEHLVGLQAQTTHTWYVGLWSRLIDSRPAAVADLLTGRRVVRIALMRSTIHLVTAADALALRPLLRSPHERGLNSNYGRHLVGLDLADIAAAGRTVVDEKPRTFSELGRVLAEKWPGRDPAALAQTVRAVVPLVQVPPRGVWGASGPAAHAALETWLGARIRRDYSLDEMLLRYLAAFGPATAADMQTWSGLTRLGEVVDRLRPRLLTVRDEQGRELVDLPDAPRPDPAVPAPVRFLYDFDNLLLSHADRTRVITDELRARNVDLRSPVPRLLLVDGFTAGTWTIASKRDVATLTVRAFRRLSTSDEEAVTAEGARLLSFLASEVPGHDVQVIPPDGR